MSDPHRPTTFGRFDGDGEEPGLAEIASVSVEGLIDAVTDGTLLEICHEH